MTLVQNIGQHQNLHQGNNQWGFNHWFSVDGTDSAMFEQAVINLMEYIGSWSDYTKSEKMQAIELYDFYRLKMKGKCLPSHKQRLAHADEIRKTIEVGK